MMSRNGSNESSGNSGGLRLAARSDQRVGGIGRTQTGKTFLFERLLAEQKNVLIIDSKQRVKFPGYFLTYDIGAALIEPRTIFRHGEIPDAWWMQAVESLHDRGGGVVYIDEIPVLTGPNRIQKGLANAFRLGAEIGVGIWWAAQEGTGVHNTVLRQTEIVALFTNLGASDRDKLTRTYGDIAEVTAQLKPHEFVVVENYGAGFDPEHIPVYMAEP